MALKITKVDVWVAEMMDRPGALSEVLEGIAAKRGSLDAVIARRQPDKPGKGVVFLSPVKGKSVTDAAKAAGLTMAKNIATLRVEGANQAGVGHRILKAIGEAGVNVRGVSALTVGKQFAAYIGFDNSADANAAAQAIKASDKPKKR
jgi:hypothetical protein